MVRVFLTDRLDDVVWGVCGLSEELMFSVSPAYERLGRFVCFRDRVGVRRVCYDSGGFDFLVGRVRGRMDPRRTVEVYKALKFRENDILIQLDVPPRPDLPEEERLKCVEKSAEFYHVMRREIANTWPVVHGWTEREVSLSFELLTCPEKCAVGSFFSITYANAYIGRVAVGTYMVSSVVLHVSRRRVYERLVNTMNFLRDRVEEIFVLGASNPNTIHIAFLLGGRYADGATWRLAAKMACIFIPHEGRFSIGRKQVSKPLKDPRKLRKWFEESPWHDCSFEEFFTMLKQPNKRGFLLRALWNAWVLKKEEEIANEYANDPERYYKYLAERWNKCRYWRNVLDFVWKRLRKAYVQERLDVFLKVSLRGGVRG